MEKPRDGVRKVKFQPRAPTRKAPKAEVKKEVVEDDDAARTMEVLKRLSNAGSIKGKPKVEKKEFGFGGPGASSAFIKSYGNPKVETTDNRFQRPAFGGAPSSSLKVEKEYEEPWNYYSYYPTSLPLRRPYSGDPELLNEEEFGGNSETMTFDERAINPEEELGVMEENPDANMIFLQLPSTLPMLKRSATANGQEASGSSRPPRGTRAKGSGTEELPEGLMGKLLIYKSGAMKLKLGDTLYDVSPGADCEFAQDVVAINTAEKQCCVLGELNKHATITPDIDSILNSMADLE